MWGWPTNDAKTYWKGIPIGGNPTRRIRGTPCRGGDEELLYLLCKAVGPETLIVSLPTCRVSSQDMFLFFKLFPAKKSLWMRDHGPPGEKRGSGIIMLPFRTAITCD